jgi:hypothetical protein
MRSWVQPKDLLYQIEVRVDAKLKSNDKLGMMK